MFVSLFIFAKPTSYKYTAKHGGGTTLARVLGGTL